MRALKVVKKADDMTQGTKVLRISIGGTEQDGAYIVYRGDLREVQRMLREVTHLFSALMKEPPISPDDGKHYA